MSIFHKVVDEALEEKRELQSLRIVVEKELLIHDILRIMREQGFLQELTFIGGTCLRLCYGGVRLSEDLDFTGGTQFSRQSLHLLGQTVAREIQEKYQFNVTVSDPFKDKQNVDTWKIKVETRPEKKHMPLQRINIDICAVPSYEAQPVMVRSPYNIDLGASGLVLSAQSREEIYADKFLAFALQPNRIKYRDIWDILWLHGEGVQPRLTLVERKLADRSKTMVSFLQNYDDRVQMLKERPILIDQFSQEMRRFLPEERVAGLLGQPQVWEFIIALLQGMRQQFIFSK